LTFAAILMFAVGFVRIISAIRYFDDGQEISAVVRLHDQVDLTRPDCAST
jgi:hypothetical protein